jgi:hypothetical protein
VTAQKLRITDCIDDRDQRDPVINWRDSRLAFHDKALEGHSHIPQSETGGVTLVFKS